MGPGLRRRAGSRDDTTSITLGLPYCADQRSSHLSRNTDMSETIGMKRIILEAVPQSAMRPPYDQDSEGGDWFFSPEGDLVIRVIGDDISKPEAFLFALHELAEMRLCQQARISQETVDKFDSSFKGEGEPGDAVDCPYREQHRKAMLIEHLMASFLGISDYGEVR